MTVFNFPDTTGQPTDGSFTWTAPSGVLYVWNGEAWVTQGSGGSSGGGSKVYVTDDLTTIADPEIGDLAYHTVEARLYVYYQDSDSQQWVDASPAGDANDSGGGIDDAPSDGNLYGRQDGAWELISGGGGGGDSSGSGADAWGQVNADGSIAGSYNIASVTKTAVGKYRVTFTTPMPNSSYSVTANAYNANKFVGINSLTTTKCEVFIKDSAGSFSDDIFYFAVHASNTIAPQAGVGADAWVYTTNFTDIKGSYNVKQVTKVSDGVYDVEFITPMPNDAYSVSVTPVRSGATRTATYNTLTTTGFRVQIFEGSNPSNTSFSAVVHASSTVTPTYTWTRNGTTLEPANDGDDVVTAGGNIKLNADGTGEFRGQKDSGGLFQIAQINNGPDKCQYEFAPTSFYFGNGLTKNGGGVGAGITLSADGSAKFKKVVAQPSSSTNIFTGQGTNGFNHAVYVSTLDVSSPNTANHLFCTANGTEAYKITKMGDASFRNAVLNLEPDDPANYTTTMLDGEEQQVYSGPTLDVKDRVLNLISRLDALEANEVIDDATDTSLLQLLANASSRLDSIEARLTALEGGN